jgi:hypothetical protein
MCQNQCHHNILWISEYFQAPVTSNRIRRERWEEGNKERKGYEESKNKEVILYS